MKMREKLEMLVAFLVFRDKMDLAQRVAYVLDSLDRFRFNQVIIECRRLGLDQQDIRSLLWEAQYNNV